MLETKANERVTIIKEKNGYMLVRNNFTLKWAVDFRVGNVRDGYQVVNVMPGDAPDQPGTQVGALTDEGISYVTRWYSESYARKWFRGNAHD